AAIMNMLPWAGPLGRTASVLGMDVTELWQPLIPIQTIGMVLMLVLAVFLGMREQRRIIKKYGSLEVAATIDMTADDAIQDGQETAEDANSLARPKLLWINAILAITIIALLMSGIIPAGLAFMIG